jgi:hypothetical protein
MSKMTATATSTLDLVDLSRRLKQEKLFVANERKEIEGLNRKVCIKRISVHQLNDSKGFISNNRSFSCLFNSNKRFNCCLLDCSIRLG